ncbi:MAG: protein kinase [Pirellulaceae bacterium]
MKVLVAEDNPIWRQLLVKHLTKHGYQPIETEDGEQAWDMVCQQDAPRLVILDWQMPKLDGIEVCRRIKRDDERPFTFVIMLTSRDAKEDMIAGLDAGADDYMTKPVDPRLLRSRLAAAKRIVEAVPPREWAKPQVPGYTINRLIGKGAFATVWEAKHHDADHSVALKLLRVDLATEDVFDRFSREIEVMKQLDHPCVAHVFDSRIDCQLGYYAMELVDGMTLDCFVRKTKPSGHTIIRLIADVCDGLAHAHAKGVIHRDLKPSNIMVSAETKPKLVDFGLCKTMFCPASGEDSAETIDGAVIGSPLFMAPEQARGQNDRLDPRSDIYSVGVVLYLVLLHRHPHKIESRERAEAIREIAQGKIVPPSELNPKFSKSLEAILLKTLAEDPDERFQSAEELGDALRQFLAERAQREKEG